jgi:hypothetical protein
MTSTRRLLALGLVLAAVGWSGPRPSDATVILGVSFEAQSASADRIFVGEVQAVESRPAPSAPRYFETLVTFRVDQPVAGGLPATLVLRFSGGQIGDLKQWIDGMPEFAVGERYVVFLEPDQTPRLVSPIVGFNQGLYRVVDAAGEAVVRDARGQRLEANVAPGMARAAAGGDPRLADFLAAIREARP